MGDAAAASPRAARPSLARLWRAHPSIRDAAAQRRARLAAGVLLCLLGVGLATLATLPFNPDPRGALLIAAALAGLALSYIFVRRGLAVAGSLLALLVVQAVVWLSRLDAPVPAEGQAILYYLGIPVLMAGFLLSFRGAIGVALATLLSAWLAEAFIGGRLGEPPSLEDLRLLVFLAAVAAPSVAASAIMQRDARLLDESAAQLRQLAENIPEVFFILSPDLRAPIFISPAYEHIWGRRVEQFMADPSDWLKGVHPEDLGQVTAALQANPFGTMEYRIVQPAGAIRHIRSQTFPVHDATGTVTRLVGVAEDITEARLATERLREANEKLRAAAAERRRMFQQVAHDLANPLNPIVLQLRILERPNVDTAKPLAIIQRNVGALRRLVEDLRDMARVDGGGLRLQLATVDVAELVAESMASHEESARARGITLEAECPGPLRTEADRDRLLQVLYNLLGNAIKFTPAGGTVKVR
ncbi:MAG TPA: PAS domain-containing sensor histidine kinase, partial [Candidatus Thermoplasmatota archaeon]|nr:PAS domain-containing sensor histidine kinase [Candidatus Thermoplasmatota archaeon]